ncbi:MAG TPA: MtrB/PioB family decaheme-associated outer membrane protein [Noviherbaspirillum sp.]|uniref:MtrB/PioB family decaheme-associated outer membrane protein n=1 Tax=Noviherbaspirillum sp. TaxID=1926288 RepID=UPI002B498F10|nr:MtrB/PioB family decaheme-associated outer membrane protein [Noviherbaspirillum sp.]HJV88642.1 MtrB/PioB family decaheme-associated outer membrane protein [Noviherbaspirillum sp.]
MKISKQHLGVSQTAIALALLAAFGPARAEDGQSVAELTTPESFVSVGVAGVSGDSKDRALFGQYNGMRNDDFYGLLNFDYLKRDNATGTWTEFKGSNLGLSTRELGFRRDVQGNWKVKAEYSELERYYPRTINTGMTGVGTTTPTINRLAAPGTGTDVDLKTKRKNALLGFEKWVSPSLQFVAEFKNEDKDGARLWGRGYDCASYVCGSSTTAAISQAAFVKNAVLLLAEPIKSNTKQIDAKFNFHDEKLMLSAGYYGSFYTNSYGSLNPVVPNLFNNGLGQPFPGYPAVGTNIIAGGGMSLQGVLQTPMALAPDNQAHQIYFDGNYAFTPTTKANFKYAYTHATQNDNFVGMGLSGAPSGMTDLGGRVDTVLAQFGLTTRPIDKLTLLANVRYENKDDKTPNALYNVEATAVTPATTPASYTNVGEFWNNNHVTSTKVNGKLEASYLLPANYRATIGADYASVEREVPTPAGDEIVAGLGGLRARNSETGYRLELRKSMSETLNGAIGYSSSKRGGSDWTSLQTSAAAVAAGAGYGATVPASTLVGLSATTIMPMNMVDLERDKWKVSADWMPTERLTVQVALENGKDKNTNFYNPVAGGKGWRDSDFKLYSLDMAFALTDNWRLTGYASYGDQTLHINHSTGYLLGLNDRNDAVGIGLDGKLSSKLQVGANLSYLNDVNKYGIDAAPSATGAPASAANLAQAAIGLPDVTFRTTTLSFFGKYALQKNADIRLDLIHQRNRLVEWTWMNNGVPFAYADNTTVGAQQQQNVSFIGVSYIYKFQ